MFKWTMGINLESVFYCLREQIRVMMELPKALRSIINVASIASLFTEVIRMVMVYRRVLRNWRISCAYSVDI